ncbi:ATPase AAA domain-containing protein 5 [Mactra antiquata]
MYLSSAYNFPVLRSYYAAVLREIELGEKSWDDDFHYLELTILNKNFSSQKYNKSKINKNENNTSDTVSDSPWFCPAFQRNKCSLKTGHTVTLKGKLRVVHHICATCLQKDKRKLEHPECSSTCPYSQSA